jgi:hypothetical protein
MCDNTLTSDINTRNIKSKFLISDNAKVCKRLEAAQVFTGTLVADEIIVNNIIINNNNDNPELLVVLSNNQTTFGNNTSNAIRFDLTVTDNRSSYSSATGNYTVPEDGVYQINASVIFRGLTSSVHTFASLFLVVSTQAFGISLGTFDGPFAVNQWGCSGGLSMRFNAGDTIAAWGNVGGTTVDVSALGFNAPNPTTSYMSIYKLLP